MRYEEDYKQRLWIVDGPSETCTKGAVVTFEGDTDDVKIQCSSEKQPLGKGKYVDGRIEGESYWIDIIERKPRYKIEAKFKNHIGGSWTAEDTSGGNSGDK
ncbi:MAG TPA: hypothetical protein VLV54_15035 [Thermoanaerobaculia bacterium]|nr:hypothetical protein [Thermoanaerobaculia bacterium]